MAKADKMATEIRKAMRAIQKPSRIVCGYRAYDWLTPACEVSFGRRSLDGIRVECGTGLHSGCVQIHGDVLTLVFGEYGEE